MLGEQVASAEVVDRGVAGDRDYALVDDETGRVVSVKRPRRWGRLFELASLTHEGQVNVVFPDGERVAVDDPDLSERLSGFLGRRVSVESTPPPDASFEESWVRELKEDVDPYFGLPSTQVEGEGELIDAGQFMSPLGNFFNFGAVHVVTTGTTRRLAELAPGSRFDAHRFRPNIVVDTSDDGFVETDWQGKTLTIGGARLAVTFTVPRCVMTTLEQGDLPADPEVLRTITQHNSVDCFSTGTRYPCVGVYANVVDTGTVTVGDAVTLD
jgi:uncharacterized protein YcbX